MEVRILPRAPLNPSLCAGAGLEPAVLFLRCRIALTSAYSPQLEHCRAGLIELCSKASDVGGSNPSPGSILPQCRGSSVARAIGYKPDAAR